MISDEELLDFDFEKEVKETKQQIQETEVKIDKSDTKANVLLGKLDKISQSFDIAVTTVQELECEVSKDVVEVKSIKSITPSDMFQLDILYSDFTNIRTTLMDTVNKGKLVIDTITVELQVAPDNAELVAGYSQLIQVVNSSMRLLTSTYKDITDVILKIKKFEENTKDTVGDASTTNIQNNFYVENVNDIIAAMRNGKN